MNSISRSSQSDLTQYSSSFKPFLHRIHLGQMIPLRKSMMQSSRWRVLFHPLNQISYLFFFRKFQRTLIKNKVIWLCRDALAEYWGARFYLLYILHDDLVILIEPLIPLPSRILHSRFHDLFGKMTSSFVVKGNDFTRMSLQRELIFKIIHGLQICLFCLNSHEMKRVGRKYVWRSLNDQILNWTLNRWGTLSNKLTSCGVNPLLFNNP